MAKVIPGATLPGRAKSLRKACYFRTFRGVLVAAKWPRPRGKPKTEEHRQQVRWFTHAQKMAKRVDAKTQITIARQTAGSPLMPRDLATSLMAGRTYAISLGPHRWIRSARAVSEVSNSLDVITTTPGQILLRGQNEWRGFPLPEAGQVWVNPAPELFWTGSTSSTNFAVKGNMFTVMQPIAIGAVAALVNMVASGVYQAALAVLDMSNVVQSVQFSDPEPAYTTGRAYLQWPFVAGLSAGDRVALALCRVDGTSTSPLSCQFANGNIYSMPIMTQQAFTIAANPLAPGQALSSSGAASFSIWPRATF